jgi:bidirectional [NiFe] hydrogenase diaphorase subunit
MTAAQSETRSPRSAVTGDSRLKRVIGAITKHHRRHDALIEVLHVVEDVYGYVPLEVMKTIAKEMRITPSKIYGVVTFYHFFSLKPKGEHNCLVCTGTACHVKGAAQLLHEIQSNLSVRPGQTTADGKLGLQTARCLGCCGLAPVIIVDNQIFPRVDPAQVVQLIQSKVPEIYANR